MSPYGVTITQRLKDMAYIAFESELRGANCEWLTVLVWVLSVSTKHD